MPTPNKVKELEKSIQHWNENLSAESYSEADTGADKCALCVAYLDDRCMDCPIANYTGVRHCVNTPYIKADKALRVWRGFEIDGKPVDIVRKARSRFRGYAKAEVELLEMLLSREKLKESVQ